CMRERPTHIKKRCSSSASDGYKKQSDCYNVNLLKGPGKSYSNIHQFTKPESYIVWAEKDGWLNLGGEQWIKNDPSYVKFSKKSTVDASIVGKRVVSKVNNLRFYDVPPWQDNDVDGTVDAELGFTIDANVSVNG
uniref:N-acetylmuramoyl-L-alanine amidase n=1 Tax=Bacillus sp. S1-R2T1-FB TaxID=1973493 RepID=UPI0021011E10